MGAFGGLIMTNKGQALQAKAQAGAILHYNRIAMGDGVLGATNILTLNALKSEKKSLTVSKLKPLSGGKAVVGAYFTNDSIVTGFYFREIGVFAQDPDEGEILYCYGNAGDSAEFIPVGGGPDVLERHIDVVTIVGNASSVTATIDESLVFATIQDLDDHMTAATLDHPDGSVTTAKLATKVVTQAKIGDKAVGTGQLADNAVGTGQLASGAATDTIIGNRSITDTSAPTGDTGTVTNLFSWVGYMIKAITGGATWRTLPGMTIAAIKAILDAATNAATASAIIKRDANGRAKVAAPSASDDIARKQEVDVIRSDNTKTLIAEVRTSDPGSPAVGQMWFRSDL